MVSSQGCWVSHCQFFLGLETDRAHCPRTFLFIRIYWDRTHYGLSFPEPVGIWWPLTLPFIPLFVFFSDLFVSLLLPDSWVVSSSTTCTACFLMFWFSYLCVFGGCVHLYLPLRVEGCRGCGKLLLILASLSLSFLPSSSSMLLVCGFLQTLVWARSSWRPFNSWQSFQLHQTFYSSLACGLRLGLCPGFW